MHKLKELVHHSLQKLPMCPMKKNAMTLEINEDRGEPTNTASKAFLHN